jgi:hypothetical protein
MPFTNAHHGGRRETLDLTARIDAELRARIEDAVDYACLEAMVKARETRGEPAPVADDPRDRDEYLGRVAAFLERVRSTLVRHLTREQRDRLGVLAGPPRTGDVTAALDVQVALARALPDYWQRFDQIRLDVGPAEPGPASNPAPPRSRRENRGLLDRLLGR